MLGTESLRDQVHRLRNYPPMSSFTLTPYFILIPVAYAYMLAILGLKESMRMAKFSSDIKKQQKTLSDAKKSFQSLVTTRKSASKSAEILIKKIKDALSDAEKIESKLQSELEVFERNLSWLEDDAKELVGLGLLNELVQKQELKSLKSIFKQFDVKFKPGMKVDEVTKLVANKIKLVEGEAKAKLNVDLNKWGKLLAQHQESSEAIKKMSDSFKV